jgi:hypothetical protein
MGFFCDQTNTTDRTGDGRQSNGRAMNLHEWEPTISQIILETNHQPKESGQHKVLTAWRAKLEKEPTSLQPFQIDEIVREVRKRLPSVRL